MEGNFYISERVVKRRINSRLGEILNSCKEQSKAYVQCVEVHQVNHNLAQDVCHRERDALDTCIDEFSKKAKHSKTKPLV